MSQPLGQMAGHSNEVVEAIDVLKGKGPADLRELSIELSAWMFYLGDRCKSVEEGRQLAEQTVASGKALERFRTCIRLQSGDPGVIDDTSLLPRAKFKADVTSPKTGYISATRCREFGIALAMLEGGRGKKEDRIDHAVGLEFHKRIGDYVQTGETLVTIDYNSDAKLADARKMIVDSFEFSSASAPAPPLIRRIIGG